MGENTHERGFFRMNEQKHLNTYEKLTLLSWNEPGFVIRVAGF